MHFEILVEDISGKKTLDLLIPKIIDINNGKNTFNVKAYKGIGHISSELKPKTDANKRQLLDQLPRLLEGYGKTWNSSHYSAILIIVCDLDKRCLKEFRKELFDCVNQCQSKPKFYFCIAIEEMEAWFLGDFSAIQKSYPNAKINILQTYTIDSICGTWEKLADAIFRGGCSKLQNKNTKPLAKKNVFGLKLLPHI